MEVTSHHLHVKNLLSSPFEISSSFPEVEGWEYLKPGCWGEKKLKHNGGPYVI